MDEPTVNCQFIYTGHNGGRRGKVCNRPESEHCPGVFDHSCDMHGAVHHPFQRRLHCPTCGTREVRP